MKSQSWQSVAHQLAARVKHLDHCDNGHDNWRDGIREGCPCCRDREAYAAFVAKAGRDPWKETYEGTTVNLLDPHSWPAAVGGSPETPATTEETKR